MTLPRSISISIVSQPLDFKSMPVTLTRFLKGRKLFHIVSAETDETKKVVLRNKVDQYVKRAEELKVQLNGGSKEAQQSTRTPEDSYRKLGKF